MSCMAEGAFRQRSTACDLPDGTLYEEVSRQKVNRRKTRAFSTSSSSTLDRAAASVIDSQCTSARSQASLLYYSSRYDDGNKKNPINFCSYRQGVPVELLRAKTKDSIDYL
ncbi:ATPase subunit 6-1 [Striga asiatica]|uniref:ATPase subunit 6-1 n=1 Tax=Striga asiatica TaxID=4170 RepID=A0A5A7PZ33_STRAF|nr:ATPase subunit 6-1 [Striga asiatica]